MSSMSLSYLCVPKTTRVVATSDAVSLGSHLASSGLCGDVPMSTQPSDVVLPACL
jgi:hypothetical protein